MSEQDGVPLFAYRHAAFAVAYVHAARAISTDSELSRNGVDVPVMVSSLEQRLTSLGSKITKACKASNSTGAKATKVTWM